MDRVETFSNQALVGKIESAKVSRSELVEWVKKHWTPLFYYAPQMTMLTNGWVCFLFSKPEDLQSVLGGIWLIKEGSIVLKHWHTSFDLAKKLLTIRHLWMLMSGFPI